MDWCLIMLRALDLPFRLGQCCCCVKRETQCIIWRGEKFVNKVGKVSISLTPAQQQQQCSSQTISSDVVDFVCECYRLRLPDSHYHNHSLHAAAQHTTCTSLTLYRASNNFLVRSIFGKVETLYRSLSLSLCVHFSARLACNFTRMGGKRVDWLL